MTEERFNEIKEETERFGQILIEEGRELIAEIERLRSGLASLKEGNDSPDAEARNKAIDELLGGKG